VPTSQPAGAKLARLFPLSSDAPLEGLLVASPDGAVRITLPPLQFAVWRATAALPVPTTAPPVALVNPAAGATLGFTTREVDGLVFPSRQEIRAEVTGGDGIAEVTFVLQRASRPGQYELLGTDDTPPYRIFWRPPPDLADDEELTFVATVNDLRGHQASSAIKSVKVERHGISFGIRGSTVPLLKSVPPPSVTVVAGQTLTLVAAAEGTGPLEYQWLRDDSEIAGATDTTLSLPATAGNYLVLVRNRAGTVVSHATEVTVQENGSEK
jgi:alpha-amylase